MGKNEQLSAPPLTLFKLLVTPRVVVLGAPALAPKHDNTQLWLHDQLQEVLSANEGRGCPSGCQRCLNGIGDAA